MDDRLEIRARRAIGEHDSPERGAIERAIRTDHSGPEALRDAVECRRTGLHDVAREAVRVDRRRAKARELRKTQRRCNALSKIFLPTLQETIRYITNALEERERESFVILKMIRDSLAQPDDEKEIQGPA